MKTRLLCFVMLVLLSFSAHAEEQDVMLHSGYPVVEDSYKMNKDWEVKLPGKFNRRVEGDGLVIWRPEFTMWFSVQEKDQKETLEDRLNEIMAGAPSEAFDKLIERDDGMIRYSYRLVEEVVDIRVAVFYGFVIGNRGHIQVRIHFDNPEDLSLAEGAWRSLTESLRDNW
jgi:hypothetical protein